MQPAILCFCHLRWNFVYQRPQHIMSRLTADHRVFFIEEPVFDAHGADHYQIEEDRSSGVYVLTPHLAAGLEGSESNWRQANLLGFFLAGKGIERYICWYYSPMMLAFSHHLEPMCTVYDCMDELSSFLFAPPALKQYEQALFERSDVVFTGGKSLYLAKRGQHENVQLYPSSIDKQHFLGARKGPDDPDDQSGIGWPRIGFYGVIDERLNIGLLEAVARMRPDWQFVLVGPTVKIEPGTLPRAENIHYLGPKTYGELPRYLAGWNIAMMPFALNDSTTYISPTKTPEYLAGGKPVISSSIADVVSSYGEAGLVRIADSPGEFIDAAEHILGEGMPDGWLDKVDRFLMGLSWDKTVVEMKLSMERAMLEKRTVLLKKRKLYV